MELFPLPLFPENGLSSSVITTVWVGVWVLCFFNLRFGWVLSGLVVPGYVAPLLLLKPLAATVVLMEGVITYALVWVFSERLSRLNGWHGLFGRDRFFALVLASVAVHLSFDGWLLPALGEWLEQRLQLVFDYRNNLHSYGLVVVSLIANQFWKTGFWRGLLPLLVSLALTALIVRYGLMEFTNFGFGSLEYVYADLASSILASPKAYIILIATSFMASRMNLQYGWDFNGILIPSLLALQWYQPTRILATLVEAGIILGLSHGLLQLPPFNRITMEGARKLLLFFNVSFLYRLALGYALVRLDPGHKSIDYYGFGYLLATLMAVKIHDKGIPARLTRATLETSLVAVAFASVVGFALTLLPDPQDWTTPPPAAGLTAALVDRPDTDLTSRLTEDRINLYQARSTPSFRQPLPAENATLQRALDGIARHLTTMDSNALNEAAQALAAVDYSIERLQGRYLYLRQKDGTPPRGWGVFVIDQAAASTLLVEVPQALEEPHAVDAGHALFTSLQARALLIAGSSHHRTLDPAGDVRLNRQSPFHLAHRVLNRGNALQVRVLTPSTTHLRREEHDRFAEEEGASRLWVKESLPRGINLSVLRDLLAEYQIRWETPPARNYQREDSDEGFAELFLSQADLKRLLHTHHAVLAQESSTVVEGYLQQWVLDTLAHIAGADTEAYRPARFEDLLFLDEEVLTPLLALVRDQYQNGQWSERGRTELAVVARSAAVLGYRLIQFRRRIAGEEVLILAEREDAFPRRNWGTYVLRLGPAHDFVIQAPRPLQELNTVELAAALFDALSARALLIAGAHPKANRDGSADVVSLNNKATMFNLVSQVLAREAGDAPLLILQSRAFGYRLARAPPDVDVLLATDSGSASRDQLDPLQRRLVDFIEASGARWGFVDGSAETVGYEVGGVAQAQYLAASRNKSFALLWLSPLARVVFRQPIENRWQNAQFAAVGFETVQADLYELLREQRLWRQPPATMKEAVSLYVRQPDVVNLAQLKYRWPGWHWRRLIDNGTKMAFLLATDANGALATVVNLSPTKGQAVTLDRDRLWDSVVRYLNARAAWLEWPP